MPSVGWDRAGRSSSKLQRHRREHLSRSSRFPDVASALVEAERKADFEEEGVHFESSLFPEFSLPAASRRRRARRALPLRGHAIAWMATGGARGVAAVSPTARPAFFS
jgi:hypothetical protein